jgi:photosystem II stability/assembly factor-like uncharacterized protein
MNRHAAILSGLLILLTLSSMRSNLGDTASRYIVYSSLDQGRSWSSSSTGLPSDGRINAFAKSGESLVAGTDHGIFISTDRAKSWQRAKFPSATVQARVTALAADTSLLFAGTTEGLLLTSSDSGKTWRINPSFPRRNIRTLHTLEGSIYVGTDADHVYKSSDAGQSWTHLIAGLPSPAQVFALTSVNGTLFAGLYAQGLYKWNARDQAWLRVGASANIAPLALASVGSTLIAGHNPGGIFWSDDAGVSWKRWTFEPTSASAADNSTTFPSLDGLIGNPASLQSRDAPIWEMSASATLAIAGAGDGIYHTTDRARTWVRATTGLPSRAPGIAFLVQGDLILASVHQKSCTPN